MCIPETTNVLVIIFVIGLSQTNNMKTYRLFFIVVTFPFLSFSQSEFSFGITQAPFYSSLGKFMNEDFILNDGTKKRHDKRSYYKYGINLSYKYYGANSNFHMAQFIMGHRSIHEEYNYDFFDLGYSQHWIERTTYNQLTYVVNYIFGKTLTMGKFSLDIGIGLSVQRIGKGIQDYYSEFNEIGDSYPVTSEVWDNYIETAGGWGVGLLGSLSGSYTLSKRIGSGIRLQSYFSFLFFNERDHIIGTYTTINNFMYTNSSWDIEVKNDFLRFDASRMSPELFLSFKL